jgi:hypothetical protein
MDGLAEQEQKRSNTISKAAILISTPQGSKMQDFRIYNMLKYKIMQSPFPPKN